MKRAPAHAGRLRPWERMVFALVFTLMAAFVGVVALAAATPGSHGLLPGQTVAANSRTVPAGVTRPSTGQPTGSTAVQRAGAGRPATGHTARTKLTLSQLDARLNVQLAAALRPVLSAHPGQVSVGVIDADTGAKALYHASIRFHSGSIATADILAALLYQHQRSGAGITSRQAELAVKMIEHGSDAAATGLWRAVGGASGVAAVNRTLLLRHTSPCSGDRFGLTKTTAADQLQLLTDLTSARSPLDGAWREYELGLMANVAADQRGGVSAAASGGTSYAVKDAWLPDSSLWVVSSIGIVQHDGHALLIAVLSRHSPTKADGMSLVRAAAVAAATVMTSPAS